MDLNFLFFDKEGRACCGVEGTMFISTAYVPRESDARWMDVELTSGTMARIPLEGPGARIKVVGAIERADLSILSTRINHILVSMIIPDMDTPTGDRFHEWVRKEVAKALDDLAVRTGYDEEALVKAVEGNISYEWVERELEPYVNDTRRTGLIAEGVYSEEPETRDDGGLVVTNDGFAWLVIGRKEASRLFDLKLAKVHKLYDDGSDALIEDKGDLLEHRGRFAIEMGNV